MMTKGTAWFDSNDIPHKTREACQQADLVGLLSGLTSDGTGNPTVEEIASYLVANADQFANILTMKDDSRPRARGQKRPRTKPDPATKDGPAKKPAKIGVIAEPISA